MNASKRSEQEKENALEQGQSRASQCLPQHDAHPRDRGDQYALKKPGLTVLDHRDRGKNRGEQNNEYYHPRIEIFEIASSPWRAGRPERSTEASTQQQPKHQWRTQCAP